tara:strand:- start:348 stop:671 length:324 start_codon:yes stop_codon:yes gene_type:complete
MSLVGPISEQTIKDFNVDLALIGAGGVDIDAGLTEFNMQDAQIKKCIIKNCRKSIVLADAEKLGKITLAKVIPVNKIDILITDSKADFSILQKIKEKGVSVFVANKK